MKKKLRTDRWFKLHTCNMMQFDALPDAVFGKLVKQALHYLDDGVITDINDMKFDSPLERYAFLPLKEWCDTALKSWQSWGKPRKDQEEDTPSKKGT